MQSVTERLIQSAAASRAFLDRSSRLKVTDFVLSRQNPDGGFRGRGSGSDLYYTVFAAASLKALGHPVPAFRIWKYCRSFGLGEELDLAHLVCLIRLRTAFPMLGRTRRRLSQQLRKHSAASAYGLFLKLLAGDCLSASELPEEERPVPLSDPTTTLAAALVVYSRNTDETVAALLNRTAVTGGFKPTDPIEEPDLLSTATALFALTTAGAALDDLQVPCFQFVESLWRDSGGFAGHCDDAFEDVEYTFYALLAIGCLIRSMAKGYGR
jgi:prenyltransferase beta subunit